MGTPKKRRGAVKEDGGVLSHSMVKCHYEEAPVSLID